MAEAVAEACGSEGVADRETEQRRRQRETESAHTLDCTALHHCDRKRPEKVRESAAIGTGARRASIRGSVIGRWRRVRCRSDARGGCGSGRLRGVLRGLLLLLLLLEGAGNGRLLLHAVVEEGAVVGEDVEDLGAVRVHQLAPRLPQRVY